MFMHTTLHKCLNQPVSKEPRIRPATQQKKKYGTIEECGWPRQFGRQRSEEAFISFDYFLRQNFEKRLFVKTAGISADAKHSQITALRSKFTYFKTNKIRLSEVQSTKLFNANLTQKIRTAHSFKGNLFLQCGFREIVNDE